MNFVSRTRQLSSRPVVTRRKTGLWFIGAVLVLVGVGIAVAVFVVNPAVHHLHTFKTEVSQAKSILQTDLSVSGMNEAQQHLTRAKNELDALRPFVFPLVRLGQWADKFPAEPGRRLKQLSALWTFSNAALDFTSGSLALAADGKTTFETDGLDGVAEHISQWAPRLTQLAQIFNAAQSARETLGEIDWLLGDDGRQLSAALAAWDAYEPYFTLIFAEDSPVLQEMTTPATWESLSALMNTTTAASSIVATNSTEYGWIVQIPPVLADFRSQFTVLQTHADPVLAYLKGSETARSLGISVEQAVEWEAFLDAVTSGGQEASAVLTLIITNMKETGAPGVVSSIPELHHHAQQARDDFTRAEALRANITPVADVPAAIADPMNHALALWDQYWPDIDRLFYTSDDVFKVMPQLLGYEHPVTFLLLIQSSDELRATGGFIGGIGTIRIEQGKITATTLREVTELDNNPEVNGQYLTRWTQPPAPLVTYMGLGHWYLRDANWWADFPSTARQAADFWAINHNTPLDGVIAITENGVLNLLAALGTLQTLDGTTVNAENMKDFAATRIYQGDQPAGRAQSALINEMSLALVDGTKDMSLGRAIRLGHYFRDAAANHDILIASFDPPTAAGLFNLGVYGALGGQNDDYFYLVESNVSYNKLSPFIEQDLRYEVELKPNGAPQEASLTVNEVNTYHPGDGLKGYPDGYYNGGRWNPETRTVEQRPTYYGGYTRLYPAPSSNLIAAIGFDEGPELFQENHRTVVGGYVGITSGEKRQLQFKWEPNVQLSHPGEYHLLVQRQPGAPAHTLTVIARIPTGYEAREVTPPPISITDAVVTWHTVLDTDQSFSLKLTANGNQPSVSLPTTQTTVTEKAPSIKPTPASTSTYQIAPAPPAPPGRTPVPRWISIPAIQVSAPVVAVGLEPSGIMASPDDAAIVGWYELGPRPGESSNAILAGHVDWKGEVGVFANLRKLQVGDTIEIQSAPDVTSQFVVESLELFSTSDAPLDEIFGATEKPTLTLITCGGPYDSIRQEYKDRLVVRARKIVRE